VFLVNAATLLTVTMIAAAKMCIKINFS